jgi:hypothetical protein
MPGPRPLRQVLENTAPCWATWYLALARVACPWRPGRLGRCAVGRTLGGLAACFWGRRLLCSLGRWLRRGVVAAVVVGDVSGNGWLASGAVSTRAWKRLGDAKRSVGVAALVFVSGWACCWAALCWRRIWPLLRVL